MKLDPNDGGDKSEAAQAAEDAGWTVTRDDPDVIVIVKMGDDG